MTSALWTTTPFGLPWVSSSRPLPFEQGPSIPVYDDTRCWLEHREHNQSPMEADTEVQVIYDDNDRAG